MIQKTWLPAVLPIVVAVLTGGCAPAVQSDTAPSVTLVSGGGESPGESLDVEVLPNATAPRGMRIPSNTTAPRRARFSSNTTAPRRARIRSNTTAMVPGFRTESLRRTISRLEQDLARLRKELGRANQDLSRLRKRIE